MNGRTTIGNELASKEMPTMFSTCLWSNFVIVNASSTNICTSAKLIVRSTIQHASVEPGTLYRLYRNHSGKKCNNSCPQKYTVAKNVPTLANCSLDKHTLILIMLGKQHQHTFRNDTHVQLSLFLHFYILYLLLNSCGRNDAKHNMFSSVDCW